MRGKRPDRRLLALLATLGLLTAGFHLLGSDPTFAFEWSLDWLEQTDPEIALVALLRVAGLLLCYWALITTTLYALAVSRGRLPQVIRMITIPQLRGIVDRALATSLVVSGLAVPAHPVAAAEDPQPAIVLEIHGDGIPVPHLRLQPAVPVAVPTESESGAGMAADASGGRYAVAPGDNLWLIAETHVRAAGERPPTEQIIVQYWRKLIDINRDNLRSHDPNLIYPGEILLLPAFEVGP